MGNKRKFTENRLKWYREVAGLSQKEASKILGFKTSAVLSGWENDLARPSLKFVLKLSHLYQTLPGELFCDLNDICREEIISAKKHLQKKDKKDFDDDS
jgi:transcriptional regulator with XRE-family HTH domain